MAAGDVQIGFRRRVGIDRGVARRPMVERAAAARRDGAVQVLAGQRAGGQRRIGEQPDILAQGHLRQTVLEGPVQQVVGVLDGGDARQPRHFGGAQVAHHAPGAFVRQADMADFAGLDQFGQRRQRLFDRHAVMLRLVLVGADAETVGDAVGPVDLVEVDVVGLQPRQAGLDRREEVGAIQPRLAIAHPAEAAGRRTDDLAGEDHPVALAARLEPAADHLLRLAVGVGGGRDGVHLRRVPEIDAAVERGVHLGMAFGLGVLAAPGHGAQADGADRQAGSAERTILHPERSLFEMIFTERASTRQCSHRGGCATPRPTRRNPSAGCRRRSRESLTARHRRHRTGWDRGRCS